jgi:hypothetical protein
MTRIEVLEGDALTCPVDVLAVKYAQRRYGLDWVVWQELSRNGLPDEDMSPPPDAEALVRAGGALGAESVLFLGVPPLSRISYDDLSAFARRAVEAIGSHRPDARSIALTLHGANFGLDEGQAFLSMVAGLEEAVRAGRASDQLRRIVFVEREHSRYVFLRDVLNEIVPTGSIVRNAVRESGIAGQLKTVAQASAARPHAFVAMPFSDKFRDVYDYAIQNALNQSGLLCERVDVAAFTGDILSHIKDRIRTSALLVADLSSANPNVYLEVGYAWGCGIPCVLLVQDTAELKFDVRGQRCIQYSRIKELETKLCDELAGLQLSASNAALRLTWPSRRLEPPAERPAVRPT